MSELNKFEILINRIRTLDPNANFDDGNHEEMLSAILQAYPDMHTEASNRASPEFTEGLLAGLARLHA